MATLSINRYPDIMQSFITNWTAANAATPIVTLDGGYTLANFTADRTALIAAINAAIAAGEVAQTAAGLRDIKRDALLLRLPQFRKLVSVLLRNSGYPNALPTQPDKKATSGEILKRYEEMRTLWATLNADVTVPGFTGPLLLQGGYALAAFTTDLAALRTLYASGEDKDKLATLSRKTRDVLITSAYNRMRDYREIIPGLFPANSAIVQSLPRISPLPGATPKAVTDILWAWDAVKLVVDITFTPSTSPHIAAYELRYSPGDPYSADNEVVVLTMEPAPPYKFSADNGLDTPGATALYKIYAMNETEHEKGSKVIKAKRPVV